MDAALKRVNIGIPPVVTALRWATVAAVHYLDHLVSYLTYDQDSDGLRSIAELSTIINQATPAAIMLRSRLQSSRDPVALLRDNLAVEAGYQLALARGQFADGRPVLGLAGARRLLQSFVSSATRTSFEQGLLVAIHACTGSYDDHDVLVGPALFTIPFDIPLINGFLFSEAQHHQDHLVTTKYYLCLDGVLLDYDWDSTLTLSLDSSEVGNYRCQPAGDVAGHWMLVRDLVPDATPEAELGRWWLVFDNPALLQGVLTMDGILQQDSAHHTGTQARPVDGTFLPSYQELHLFDSDTELWIPARLR